MAPRPALHRLKDRPDAENWRADELVSLAEAVALLFPHGTMTATALRIAYARGELGGAEICGKLYTTPAALAALVEPRRKPSVTAPAEGAPPAEVLPEPPRCPAKLRRHLAAAHPTMPTLFPARTA